MLRGVTMRKFMIFSIGFIAATTILLSTGFATAELPQKQPSAEEQVILRLLSQPISAAVEEYCGGFRQYWRQEVLKVQKVPESPYYEVVIRVETFYGAHNPPYGLETMTFNIGPLDHVQLVSFDHQAEPD